MILDEIGENCENLKAIVVSDTTNKTGQERGGQKVVHVPMEVDYVSGSRTRRGGLGRCGGGSKGIDMLHLRKDGTHSEEL